MILIKGKNGRDVKVGAYSVWVAIGFSTMGLLSVCLKSAYLAETEKFLLKVL